MPRLPGDPDPLRKGLYTLGVRLPDRYLDWVRHDLTDADWRLRLIARHMLVLLPFCLLFLLLPGPWGLRVAAGVLLWVSSMFVMILYAGPIRDRKLRQHGLDAPSRGNATR